MSYAHFHGLDKDKDDPVDDRPVVDDRRVAPPSTPDEELAAQERADAAEAFARHEPERPRRIELLLGRVVELLESLSKRG